MENDCSSDQQLSGTCAVRFDADCIQLEDDDFDADILESLENAIARANAYDGVQLVLIASKYGYEDGWDQDEIILEDADVLAVLD